MPLRRLNLRILCRRLRAQIRRRFTPPSPPPRRALSAPLRSQFRHRSGSWTSAPHPSRRLHPHLFRRRVRRFHSGFFEELLRASSHDHNHRRRSNRSRVEFDVWVHSRQLGNWKSFEAHDVNVLEISAFPMCIMLYMHTFIQITLRLWTLPSSSKNQVKRSMDTLKSLWTARLQNDGGQTLPAAIAVTTDPILNPQPLLLTITHHSATTGAGGQRPAHAASILEKHLPIPHCSTKNPSFQRKLENLYMWVHVLTHWTAPSIYKDAEFQCLSKKLQ